MISDKDSKAVNDYTKVIYDSMKQDRSPDLHRDEQCDRIKSLEFFLLALIEMGDLSTIYQFARRAGLSPGGATIIALQALERKALVVRDGPSGRGTNPRAYRLTEEGRRALRKELIRQLQLTPASLEQLQRALWAAYAMRVRDPKVWPLAAEFLSRAAQERESTARDREKQMLAGVPPNSTLLDVWRWMRGVSEVHRLRADATAIRSLIRRFS